MTQLTFKAEPCTRVELSGDIAGELEPLFKKLREAITGKRVIFDIGGLGQMNSEGFRQWVAFLKTITVPYEFHDCPVFFVDYSNLFADALGRGAVVSFRVPMKCPGCRRAEALLLSATDAARKEPFGGRTCGKCGSELQAEVDADDYLAFLSPG